VGLSQLRPAGRDELPLLTTGDDLVLLAHFLPPDRDAYTAADVLRVLLSPAASPANPKTQAA